MAKEQEKTYKATQHADRKIVGPSIEKKAQDDTAPKNPEKKPDEKAKV